jgi:hypothetical protein
MDFAVMARERMAILMSDIIQRLRDTYASNPAAALNLLPELFKQYDEGLIKALPCKVGDTVYWCSRFGNAVHQGKVYEIKISRFGFDLELKTSENQRALRESEKCYSTREAAEKALEGKL